MVKIWQLELRLSGAAAENGCAGAGWGGVGAGGTGRAAAVLPSASPSRRGSQAALAAASPGTAVAQSQLGSGSCPLRWELVVSKTRWGLAGLLTARAPGAEHVVGVRSVAGPSGGMRHPSFSASALQRTGAPQPRRQSTDSSVTAQAAVPDQFPFPPFPVLRRALAVSVPGTDSRLRKRAPAVTSNPPLPVARYLVPSSSVCIAADNEVSVGALNHLMLKGIPRRLYQSLCKIVRDLHQLINLIWGLFCWRSHKPSENYSYCIPVQYLNSKLKCLLPAPLGGEIKLCHRI